MARKTKYTEELLKPLISASFSNSEVLRKLGLKNTGGNYRMIATKIRLYCLDASHFTGPRWNKGLTAENNESIRNMITKRAYTHDETFCENSVVSSGTKIKKRLINLGWTYECSCCKLVEWLGNSLTLHLDHINGINNDNRLENLRLLCPNCHQQTDTWGNKGKSFIHSTPIKKVEQPFHEPRVRTTKMTVICKMCNNEFTGRTNTIYCSNDCRIKQAGIGIPSIENIKEAFSNFKSYVQVGKHFGVSDNAVRKWCKKYEMIS